MKKISWHGEDHKMRAVSEMLQFNCTTPHSSSSWFKYPISRTRIDTITTLQIKGTQNLTTRSSLSMKMSSPKNESDLYSNFYRWNCGKLHTNELIETLSTLETPSARSNFDAWDQRIDNCTRKTKLHFWITASRMKQRPRIFGDPRLLVACTHCQAKEKHRMNTRMLSNLFP